MSRQPPEVLKVLVWPTPLLATVSETETFEDPKSLRRLIDAMWHTMYMHNGIGLAAVQVGVAKRIFVMDTGAGTCWVFINPKIIAVSGPKVLDEEGCLSVPGRYAPRGLRHDDAANAARRSAKVGRGAHLLAGFAP